MKARHLKENIKASKLQKLIQYEETNGYTEQKEDELPNEISGKSLQVNVVPRHQVKWSEATVDDIWLYYFDDCNTLHWFYGDQKLSDIVLSGFWRKEDMAHKRNYLFFLISRGQPLVKSKPEIPAFNMNAEFDQEKKGEFFDKLMSLP